MFIKRPKEFEIPVDQETKTHHGLDKDMLPPSSDEENEEECDESWKCVYIYIYLCKKIN